jgi:Na+(H+)/acetate symporter ActP
MIVTANSHFLTIVFFLAFIVLSLGLTYWAMRSARSASGFFVALVSPAFIGPKGLVLSNLEPLISLTNPGIVSIPLGFVAGWLGTIATSKEPGGDHRFGELHPRALTGFGAEVGDAAHSQSEGASNADYHL